MSMYRTEGIVLRNRPLGEADRIVTVFTRDEGVIEAVARGARRPRSRLVATTLPFTQLQMLIFRGKSLDSLSQAEIVNSFQDLRDDLLRMAYGMYWCELVGELLPARDPNEQVYLFFLASLLLLEQTLDPALLSAYFELRLVSHLGYRPVLDSCSACGDPAEGWAGGSFLPLSGTLLCPKCTLSNASGKPLSGGALALFRSLMAWDMRRLDVLKPEPHTLRQLSDALRAFAAVQVGRPPKSLSFLEGLESQA